jgi:P27 family predicted phage terminase small subunit
MPRGRKAIPIQILRETNEKTNHLSKAQLEARANASPSGIPSLLRCPKRLSPEARKEWRRLVKLFRQFKEPLINDLDAGAIEIYVNSIVEYRLANTKIRETSEVYAQKTPMGPVPKINPWVQIRSIAENNIKRFGEILLMEPSSRARIAISKTTEEESPMAKYLRLRRERMEKPLNSEGD